MSHDRPVTCENCGWKGTVSHTEPIAPRYLPERVLPGDVMPAGECPECGANAMLDPDTTEPALRIVTVRNPEQATHFAARSTAHSLADFMATAIRRHSYRLQDMDRHGFRVAVYRPLPNPGMFAQGYLRVETD